jgi:hypothetical protein
MSDMVIRTTGNPKVEIHNGIGVGNGATQTCCGGITYPVDGSLDWGESIEFEFLYGAKSVSFEVTGAGGGGPRTVQIFDMYGDQIALESNSDLGTFSVNGGSVIKKFRLQISQQFRYLILESVKYVPLSC